MANTKIASLTALTGAGLDTAADLIVVDDTSAVATKKMVPAQLRLGLGFPAAVAYTQTYSTADRTVAAMTSAAVTPTSATLTDSSGGTSGTLTIAAIGGAVDPTAALKTATANAVATLAAMVNKLTADVAAVIADNTALRADVLGNKKNNNAVIDDLQNNAIAS